MIAQWMLYCLAVGALLSLGALAAEGAMRAFRLPQRWVWAAAMVLTLALPAAARWLPGAPAPAPAAAEAGNVQATRLRLADFPAAAAQQARTRIDAASLDRPLALAWAGLSAAALIALLAAAGVLARRRRGWRAAEMDGVPVLLSPATGPAVVGLFRSRIVLPEWVQDAEPEVRALLLEHEREHLRAGDPRLLALGLAAVALAPWNPAGWWQLRRLRLAMEVDCDARVLARRADVRAYGTLLLEVGRRAAGGGILAAAAFSEPRSFLERRIRIMTSPRVRFPWLRAGAFGAVAVSLVAVACETPGPVTPAPVGPASVDVRAVNPESRNEQVALRSAAHISRAEIRGAVERHFPEVLRAAPTESASLLFVVGPDGRVKRSERTQLRTRVTGTPPSADAQVQVSEIRASRDSERMKSEMENSMVDVISFGPGQMGPGRVEVLWIRELAPGDVDTRVEIDSMRVSEDTGVRTARTPPDAMTQGDRSTMITAEQARGYVTQYLPQVAANGTAAEFVWFMADASGRIIGHGTSEQSEALNARSPDSFENVQVFKAENVSVNGHEIPVIYVRLKS